MKILKQSSITALKHLTSAHPLPQLSVHSAFVVLTLVTLACGFAGAASQSASNRATDLTPLPTLTRTRLPTFTPTASSNLNTTATVTEPVDITSTLAPASVNTTAVPVVSDANPTSLAAFTPTLATDSTLVEASATALSPTPTNTATAFPSDTPTVPATETPQPTETFTPQPTDTPTATATAEPKIVTPGWAIAGVRLLTSQSADRVVVYGDLINNTGSAQELSLITGTFRDAEGQVTASAESINDYWPIDVVPSGGKMPFELTILGNQSVASFDLSVEAEPSSQAIRQDFDFLDIDQWAEGSGYYCVAGNVRNSGDLLQEYLVVAAILFDDQDNVISFGSEAGPPPSMVGIEALPFEICDQPLDQEVARYELRTWGR